MASTNKTTNYELSQFVETDRPAWLTDYNSDMRKLDTALKAVSDVADGASGGISSLTDRMTAAEGAITTNANDIDALEARADNLEAQAQSTAGTIAGIQTEQTAQNLGIEAATELGYNLARPYDSASTYAVGAYVLFQNTLYKCITAVATGEAFDPAKWLAIKATDEIAAGGYTLPIASASQLGGVKVGNGLSIDPVTGVLSASGGESVVINNVLTHLTISGEITVNSSSLQNSLLIQIGNIYLLYADVLGRTLNFSSALNPTNASLFLNFNWNTGDHPDFIFPASTGGLNFTIGKFSKRLDTATPTDLDIFNYVTNITNSVPTITCTFNNADKTSTYNETFYIRTLTIFNNN